MARSKDEMTIVEHLVEFRRRFIAVVLCFFLVFCITLLFAGELYAYLTRGFDKPLLVLGPNDILWIYINLASLMAFTVTLPFTTYQIWQFVKPGLRDNEARAIFADIPAIVLGLAFGYYFVSPAILEVLLKLGEGLFDTQITAQNYLSFLLHTTVPLAVLFELPVVVSFLTSIGIITPVFLTRYRRYAYFILLVLAVVLTPADFISDLAMTAPLILLYEVSVTLSKLIYKRKQRKYKDK